MVTHATALHFLRLQTKGVRRCTLSLDECADIVAIDPAAVEVALGLSGEGTLHVGVTDDSLRRRKRGVAWHAIHLDQLPERSFVAAGEGIVSASPELCFVNLAAGLGFSTLVELGFELCGTYSRTPNQGEGFVKRAPLTSVARLLTYVGEAEGAYGVRKARRALRFVVDGAASPMEAALAMLLTLPVSRGGYYFESPQLNAAITVPLHMREAIGANELHCDLLWPAHHVAVEYDSDRYHVGADLIAWDARRRNDLKMLGIDVVTATSRQVLDANQFHDHVVNPLAKAMGRRLRIRAKDPYTSRWRLRRELFSYEHVVP